MLFACPVGVAAALFAAEFAPRRLREVIKPVIELLAGIPSVVLGFFALMVLATLLQEMFGFTYRLNAMIAGLALGLRSCPSSSRFPRTRSPRCRAPTGRRLCAGRHALGDRVEGGAARGGARHPRRVRAGLRPRHRRDDDRADGLRQRGHQSFSPGRSVRSLSATIAAEMGEVVVGSAHYSRALLHGRGAFVFTFVLNIFGQWVMRGHPAACRAAVMRHAQARSLTDRRHVAVTLLGRAFVLIVAMLAVILGTSSCTARGGLRGSSSPRRRADGMMGGGIFPALFGTAALTLLMTLAACRWAWSRPSTCTSTRPPRG